MGSFFRVLLLGRSPSQAQKRLDAHDAKWNQFLYDLECTYQRAHLHEEEEECALHRAHFKLLLQEMEQWLMLEKETLEDTP